MTEFFCCMRKSFNSKKLNGTGYYDIDESVDPDIIFWENIGKSKVNRFKEYVFGILCAIVLLAASICFFEYVAYSDRKSLNVVASTCSNDLVINIETAYRDLILPAEKQRGILGCYCRQIIE